MKLKTVAIILVVILAGTIISGCTGTKKNPGGDGMPAGQDINASNTPFPNDDVPPVNTSVKQMPGTPSKTPVSTPVKTYIPISSTTPGMSIDEIKKNAIAVKYVDLSGNNKNYIGKIVYFRAQVFELQADTNILLVYITKPDPSKDYWSDQVWVNNFGIKFLEESIIDVWAKVKGQRSYNSSMGQVTIPEVDPLYIELAVIAQ